MKYLSSSESVSSGHPDRLCDNLGAIIINDIQKKDGPSSHAAVEVFLTHDSVIYGGEVTTTLDINDEYLREVTRKGFEMSGYLPIMRGHWTKEELMLADDLQIVNKICAQSPDIALGTTDKGEDSGWNDQGVFFSSSDDSNSTGMGTPMLIATAVCEFLQDVSRASFGNGDFFPIGPDIKAVVTCEVEEDGFTPISIKAITLAVPHTSATPVDYVRSFVKNIVSEYITTNKELFKCPIADDCQWVINGTGRYVSHGCVADTSLTGRKISVNHPSAGPLWCNKMIGGGSLVKPWHASDLLLNVASRFVANVIVAAGLSKYAVVGCAGAIGQKGLQSLFIKGDDAFDDDLHQVVNEFFKEKIDWSPKGLAELFGFFTTTFDFAQIVDRNFFGHSCQPWEFGRIVFRFADDLKNYIGK